MIFFIADINDLLHSRGFSRFLTATDIDSLKMLKPLSIRRFEDAETKTRFFITLSLVGSYLDGKRYRNHELVEMVNQKLEWFPNYVRETVFQTYEILRGIPIHEKASDSKEWNVMKIGRELASFWEKCFRNKL